MTEVKGAIFEIHRFSLNDGPGIRTTIFLKGCPLSCSWCHNYESQVSKQQLYYDPERCINCGNCAEVCPNGAQVMEDGQHQLKLEKCDLFGNCAEVCSSDTLKIFGHQMSINEVLAEVEMDQSYFVNSKGGVTISGGEPMQQFRFLFELVKRLKKDHFHVCLDTSGYASQGLFKKIAPYVDLFHFDIKSFDTETHKHHTGVDNEIILSNLEFLAKQGKNIVLRCPVIPGVNDQKDHFLRLARLASEYSCIERIDLLPYHKMGEKKACNLRNGERQNNFSVPGEEEKNQWKKWISEHSKVAVKLGS